MSAAAETGAGPYPITPRRPAFDGKSVPVAMGLLSAWSESGTAIPRYLRRSYHPSQEGSPRRAVEYPAASPAARTAAGAASRAAMS
ncbi:hypothetical protein AMK16_17840 [Streptomyces sp. CB00455]|nr:hypothetical protein AMK16_17840 [Streptomyces sp. CB00455]